MRVSQVVSVEATILNVAALELPDVGDVLQLTRRSERRRRLVGEHRHDELSRLESVDDTRNQVAVAGGRDVALEAHV